MILDSEEQRHFLLEIIKNSSIPGSVIDKVASLKRSIEIASLASPPPKPPPPKPPTGKKPYAGK